MSPGLLLAFEGADGVGKTLQARSLLEWLEGRGMAARLLREPGGTEFGEKIRDLVLDASVTGHDACLEALLFSASRRRLVIEQIQPALDRGEIVLLDRSYLSTLVYQGVVGGMPLPILDEVSHLVHGDAWPSRILLLDLSEHERQQRRLVRNQDEDGFESRGDAYLESIAEAFRQLQDARPELVHRIDAAGTPSQVFERILSDLGDLIREVEA
jgi:dTMP kinase